MALLHDWTFEPDLMVGITLVALLYARGVHYCRHRGMARYQSRGRVVSFAAGLLAVVIALESPIDRWSDRYLWVHMVQHESLTMVAAPLLVLGLPALPLLRAIPLGMRRSVLRWGMRQGWLRHLWGAIGHPLGSPRAVWFIFVGDFALWHLPPLYDLTLEQAPIHYLEHFMFLGTAFLFWTQIIPSRPYTAHCSLTRRAALLGSLALFGNLLDVLLIAVPVPIYAYYATVPRSPGMMPVLVDQSVAAGIMGVGDALLLAGALLLWRRSLDPSGVRRMVELSGSRRGQPDSRI